MLAEGAPRPTNFYVDCSAGSGDGDGRSVASAWNSLKTVNAHTFSPGDIVRFHRGTECLGTLRPQGNGSPDAPIRVTAYGEGDRPKITAQPDAEESFALYQQEYWDVDSLDLAGGGLYGVYVSGRTGVLHHIHLANLVVHDVGGGELKNKDSGLVLITPGTVDQHFDDVLVDGVTAYNTRQWMGILVGGGNFGFSPESTWNTRVIVRNSTVHDVQGDGIVLFRVRDGRIDSSIAWNTGMQITETIGTPNAIWTWMCHDCVVINNEAFLTDSPGVDGGAFDIDYGNTNNSVLSNYGHDTQGYCIAVFGAGGVTHDSTARGNVCINNARSPRMAQFQGAIFLHTWNGGTLDGVTIAENVVYWNPPGTFPALVNDAAFQGGKAIFRGNAIYSTSPAFISTNDGLSLDANHYLYGGSGSPWWEYASKKPAGFAEYQKVSSQDQRSELVTEVASATDPIFPKSGLLHSPTQDQARGQAVLDASVLKGLRKLAQEQPGKWQLYCRLSDDLDSNGLLNESTRRQLAVVKSLYLQFHSKGLDIHVVFPSQSDSRPENLVDLQNAMRDSGIEEMQIVRLSTGQTAGQSEMVLLSPDGRIAGAWQGFTGPAQVGPLVRQQLGVPLYSQLESR